jgi:hypothetical protein
MLTRTTTTRALAVLAAVATAACGGSGGSSTAGIDRGGISAPALASGTINGFGSIIVRGTRFATDGAAIVVDGAPAVEAALNVGQVVAVTGEIVGGTQSTTRIELEHDVIGAIASIGTDEIVVLGQTVRVDATTSYAASIPTRSIEGLATGNVVAISGFYAADGSLLATRIEQDAPAATGRVHGFVTALDTAARRLRINGLDVDYSVAAIEGFPNGEPRAGDFVAVLGPASGTAGALRATLVQWQQRAPFTSGAQPLQATIEGLVTRFASAADFEIDGQPAAASGTTPVHNGALADLRLDARVVATGEIGASGVLSVATLAFVPATDVQLQAPITAIDVAANTLIVLGTTIRVLPETYIEDLTGGERVFTLADLAVGDWVTLSAYTDAADPTRLIATRLARDNDDDDDIEIVGPVRTLADPEFTIAAVRILTTSATEFDDLDRDEFFSGPLGRVVEVEGMLSGNVVVASEVEPED